MFQPPILDVPINFIPPFRELVPPVVRYPCIPEVGDPRYFEFLRQLVSHRMSRPRRPTAHDCVELMSPNCISPGLNRGEIPPPLFVWNCQQCNRISRDEAHQL